jgi:hypothetical protein
MVLGKAVVKPFFGGRFLQFHFLQLGCKIFRRMGLRMGNFISDHFQRHNVAYGAIQFLATQMAKNMSVSITPHTPF